MACFTHGPSDGQTGSYSGPEVPFADIVTLFLELRFWIVSGLPTIREVRVRAVKA